MALFLGSGGKREDCKFAKISLELMQPFPLGIQGLKQDVYE